MSILYTSTISSIRGVIISSLIVVEAENQPEKTGRYLEIVSGSANRKIVIGEYDELYTWRFLNAVEV
jgi:hypothetical protein